MIGLLLFAALADAPPPPGRVAELVARLGAGAFADREAAERELDRLGLAALPAVRAAVSSPDPEVAWRAAALLPGLQAHAVTAAVLAGPVVRLDAVDVPLAAVLAEVTHQSGLAVVVDPPERAADRVTVRTGGTVPFWQAVEAVAAAAGLSAEAGRGLLTNAVHPPRPVAVVPLPARPGPAGPDRSPPPDRPTATADTFAELQKLARTGPLNGAGGLPLANLAWINWSRLQGPVDKLRTARQQLAAARHSGRSEACVLRPGATPPTSVAGAARVTAVPLPPGLQPFTPAGAVAVAVRVESAGGVLVGATAGRADRPLVPPRLNWPDLGELAPLAVPVRGGWGVVGPDGRPRLVTTADLPAGGVALDRDAALFVLAGPVPANNRLADFRGTLTGWHPVSVTATAGGPAVRSAGPAAVELAVEADKLDAARLTVRVRLPRGGRVAVADPRLLGWGVGGPVELAPDVDGRTVGFTGRPGATADEPLPRPGSLASGLFGAGVLSDGGSRRGRRNLFAGAERLAVRLAADGAAELTLVLQVTGASGRPEVAFNALLPVEVPFHLRDVPVWAGTGPAE